MNDTVNPLHSHEAGVHDVEDLLARTPAFDFRLAADKAAKEAEDTAYLVQHYADAAHSLAQAADLLSKCGFPNAAVECALSASQLAFQTRHFTPTPASVL